MNQELEIQFNRKRLGKFVLPTILMMVFMSLYTIIDGIFVSRMVGSDALAAINIVFPAINIMWGIAIMFAAGGSAIIARNLGEGQSEKARQRFSLLVYFNVFIGIILLILGIVFQNHIVGFLGASEGIWDYARTYLQISALFAPIALVKTLFDLFVITAGKPALGFILTLIGGITNIVLDYVFIGPLNMGIAGAAWATGIGMLIPAIIGCIFFLNKKHTLYFCKPSLEYQVIMQSMLNGSSEMVTNLAGGVTTFLFNMAMMNYLGEDGVAAITVIMYSQFLLSSAYLGFTSGVAPIISFKYGSHDLDQLKAVMRYCIEFILISSVAIVCICYLIAPQIVGAFVDSAHNVYEIALNGFNIFGMAYLFMGINIFASGMFTAFSNGKISAIISFLRTLVFVVIGILGLPILIGVPGIWLAVPLAELTTMMISIYFIRKYKKVYQY